MNNGSEVIYKEAIKGIGIFGGVQIFLILVGLIKNKVLAVLLGPEGVGIISVYTNTLSFLTTATALGIGFSAIRNIAEAQGSGNQVEIDKNISVTRKWIWFTGLLGLLVTLVLSPYLSQVAFGDRNHIFAFALLSVTLLLTSISSGQSALLRGLRKLKQIATSSLYGALAGLVLSLPLYFYYREKGIVPSIIITSFTTLFFTWIYARKVPVGKVSLTVKDTYRLGYGMAKLGTMMTLSNVVNYFCIYLITIYISNKGGLSQVGFYQSGWSLVVVYTNTILASISADYYPRLAAVNSDNHKVREIANHQAELLLLLLGPMIILMIIFIPQLIVLLYSREFLGIVIYVSLLLCGTLLHAATITVGYIFMAKGDSTRHLFNEVGIKTIILPLTIVGFYLNGLIGAGIAYIAANAISLLLIYLRANKYYEFSYNKKFIQIFFTQILGCLMILSASFILNGLYKYLLIGGIGSFIVFYSFFELNKLIALVPLVKSMLRKLNPHQ
jgi:O-antigen/teichoic acid export membrane protein